MKKFLWTLFLAASVFGVELLWDANSETNLAGYRVYYGPASRTYTTVVDVGNFTSVFLPTPSPGSTRFFCVTAYDTDGLESEFSEEVFYTGAPQFTLLGNRLSWTADLRPDLLRYEILSGWSPDTSDGIQYLEPQYLFMWLIQNPARKWYKIRSRYVDGSASEYSPQVSWESSLPYPKAAPPRMLTYPLPGPGRWLVESTFALLDPAAWVPFDEVTGPIDFQIVVDTSIPERYFRARLIP